MKIKKLNDWLTLLANVGVIAGILFLGYELRQNNELMRAEARADRRDGSSAGAAYGGASGHPTSVQSHGWGELYLLVCSLSVYLLMKDSPLHNCLPKLQRWGRCQTMLTGYWLRLKLNNIIRLFEQAILLPHSH